MGKTRVILTSGAVALITAAAAFASGGTDIATAPVIDPATQYFGNAATSVAEWYDERPAEYWKIDLIAGDRVTVDWRVDNRDTNWLFFFRPGTTDYSMNDVKPAKLFEVGNAEKIRSVFVPTHTGTHPFVFVQQYRDQGGPYDFTVHVRHLVRLSVPRLFRIHASGSQLTVTARTPDAALIPSGVRLTLAGRWSGKWHRLGRADVQNGRAAFSFKVPAHLRGTSIELRVTGSGPAYLPARLARIVHVTQKG